MKDDFGILLMSARLFYLVDDIIGGGGGAEAEALGKAHQKVLKADVQFAPKQTRALLAQR